MLKSFSENSLSGLSSNSQTRGPDRAGRAPCPAVEPQTLMESKMSSQTLVQANVRRSSLARSALVIFAVRINGHVSAFTTLFMDALCESRLRQAEQVIRRYRHLIDSSNDCAGKGRVSGAALLFQPAKAKKPVLVMNEFLNFITYYRNIAERKGPSGPLKASQAMSASDVNDNTAYCPQCKTVMVHVAVTPHPVVRTMQRNTFVCYTCKRTRTYMLPGAVQVKTSASEIAQRA